MYNEIALTQALIRVLQKLEKLLDLEIAKLQERQQ